MEFLVKAPGTPERLGILPGSFHPVTRAHIALAEAALEHVGEVVMVMPRAFPHKEYEGLSLRQRLELLRESIAQDRRFSIGITEGGLFLEIARECRAAYGSQCELWLLCGRDAAERIVAWDYADVPGITDQLEEYGLLVADRHGSFEPAPGIESRVRRVVMGEDWNEVSATEVRRRIAANEAWEHLVPESAIEKIRAAFQRGDRIERP